MSFLMGAGMILTVVGVSMQALGYFLDFEQVKEPVKTQLSRCAYAHSENGLNYPWLSDIHNGLDYIEYEEPVGSANWRRYTDKIWEIHCKKNVINHEPKYLVQEHTEAFINPQTRFARLMFHFKDGHKQEPTISFYEREKKYFEQYFA